MRREVLMPHLSDEAEEGVVVTWFVEPGASVREGDLLAELQVQKVSSELRSPFGGRVEELLVEPGGVVAQGAPVAVLEVGAAATAPAAPAAPASPSARRLAAELRVDLGTLTGTGPGGRIVEADVQAAARAGTPARTPESGEPAPELEPLSPMRRAIADRLRTWLGATAQVTLVGDADVTDLEAELRHVSTSAGRQASFVEAVTRAVALALRHHPRVGARWTDAGLAHHAQIDVGVAVSLDDGLITPVVRAADTKDVATLGREIAELAERARAGRLAPADTEGAGLSVTNLGAYRIDAFTPLLNPPQTAIVGVGRARRRPAVVDDAVVARTLMTLSLTFDHRVIDGAPAAGFLTEVLGLLEDPPALGLVRSRD